MAAAAVSDAHGTTTIVSSVRAAQQHRAHLERQDGAVDADWVADLNGARKRRLRLHRLKVLPTLRGMPAVLILLR